jgi:THO complex subunit 7
LPVALSIYSETSIREAQAKIRKCQQELREAKTVRKHRQNYDLLAGVIQQHPDRQESMKQMAELKTELTHLKDKREMLHRKLDSRRKQFHVLVHSIQGLQKLLEGMIQVCAVGSWDEVCHSKTSGQSFPGLLAQTAVIMPFH